ncbi:hypothetical protein [Salinithrix halophila]|uniref:Uncharacterized protein n=1 Tax=Salinithrix halophila TaxID=1485204 RepID=A0ABV8JGI1_9BACL
MFRSRFLGVGAALLLILAAFIIPFTLLDDVRSWTGAFLFWILFALTAVLLNAWIASKWRDPR